MLIYFCLAAISVVSISCPASAFSSLFVMEEEGGGRKAEVAETRTQKTEENNVTENQVIVETIPFVTDVFTKAEDVINLTPLKVATMISAQHLLDTVKHIPASGNNPGDILNTLSNIVDQFNKTAEIIKLTSEYVNISSHYILNSLNQVAKENHDQEAVNKTLKTVNQNFLGVISNHIRLVVREIIEKTKHREVTGSDVLVSSAFHIVAAFQEMTNQVMSLKTDNTKCDLSNLQITPPNSEQDDIMETKTIDETLKTPKQDEIHKSIKKDQALPKTKLMFNQENLQNALTIENIDQNPDLTIEVFPSEPFINQMDTKVSKKLDKNIPESLQVAFFPEINPTYKENKQGNQFVSEGIKNKITKKNLINFDNSFAAERVNPNQELTVEILSPQEFVYNQEQESPSKTKEENKPNGLESFNLYYYPLKTIHQQKVLLPNTNTNHDLKVPVDVKGPFPQNPKARTNFGMQGERLKQVFTPLKTFSLFGDSTYKNIKQKKHYRPTKAEETQTNFNTFDDTLTMENLNRQDLTVEVFSPEAYIHKGRDDSVEMKQENMNLFGTKETKLSPKSKSRFNIFQNENAPKNHKHFNHDTKKVKNYDRELASSAVDSLSNVPPMSVELERQSIKGKKYKKVKENSQNMFSTVLTPWSKGVRNFKNPFGHKSKQKHNPCDERVEPVCGIDKNKSNFIIFLNDCQRKHHNSVYKTSYEWANMDTCVGLLLKHSDNPTKYMNTIPR